MDPDRPNPAQTRERDDLLAIVADQRTNFGHTLTGLTDAQAATRGTVSELTLGGLVKHLTRMQRNWIAVIQGTAPARKDWSDLDPNDYRMLDGETLAELLDALHVADATFDETVRGEPDLDRPVTLPRYPWSPPEPTVWTVRRVLLHAFREIAHHSGHADIIREALDGASTTARITGATTDGRSRPSPSPPPAA